MYFYILAIFSTGVKIEQRDTVITDAVSIKEEEDGSSISLGPRLAPATRIVVEGRCDYIEIIDSDAEEQGLPGNESDQGSDRPSSAGWLSRGSYPTAFNDDNLDYELLASEYAMSKCGADLPLTEDLSLDEELVSDSLTVHRRPSDTVWLDTSLSSDVLHVCTQIMRELTVEMVEFLSTLPSSWPIPRVPTAYVIDLSDPAFLIHDKKGAVYSVDALIKNKDQDSWSGSTGGGRNDTTSRLPAHLFGINDREYIVCRRSRLRCSGFSACENIEGRFLNVQRHELDPAQLESLLEAQIQSRMQQADHPDKITLTFCLVLHARPCGAIDSDGVPCNGKPILKPYRNGPINGKTHFVACSSWSLTWKSGHRITRIPSNVNVERLQRVFSGESLQAVMQTCSRIVPVYVGAKLKACAYPHNAQGEQSRMVRHSCAAKRVAGVTAGSLEHAPSTQLILNGKTPGEFHASLHSKRKKNEIVRLTKQIQFPSGFGIEGVLKLFQEDTARSDVKERYVHHLTTTPTGGMLICTFVPFLLSLIHSVNGFQVDVTYKRVYGPLKEWEVTIWFAALTRAVTIGRVYTDKADREHYKIIFDELQRWVLRLTGKPLRFKRLSKGGNLIYLGVDLEAAQVLGAGDSFLPTNEPEYSRIHTPTSEDIVGYFIRAIPTLIAVFMISVPSWPVTKTISAFLVSRSSSRTMN
ncbi:hypothetical protein HGRIS_006526 [Hohenbuehelia grisea]|uniref:Uncharacterized protein n=1 Tax=Hohenbuehelia grisea TaxID=104357 RepID=A0ABR3J9L3_9AGAR